MKFEIEKNSFRLNGEPFFLHSAEVHYFRIKKEKWDLHISKVKQAGCNTVCTYVPWDWHEPKEGKFDFKDLEEFIDLCKKHGLYFVVKPGPYILAEYAGAGIPRWFIEKYRKKCEVKNSAGGSGQEDTMSFMHPIYLEYVKKWYDAVMPVFKSRQISAGGNIIMMQVCNEVGVFTWLKKQADYSPHCLNMYKDFLKNKYKNSKDIDFTPPTDTGYEYKDKEDLAKDIVWHEFWRFYYVQYLKILMNEIKNRGIDLLFYHNLPGWIYGSGWEFPVNITMYNELYKEYPNIILGVDHIPENVSYRNFHDDMIINEIVKAQQGGNGPLFGAEFQSGSREYCTVTFPGELDLFYKASIANGLAGWNYYMFSQGKNPPGKGFFGPTFYWFTPLDVEGNEGTLYPVVKKMGDFVNVFGKDIASLNKKAKIGVLFYQRYYATELAKNIPENCKVIFDHKKVRRSAFFDGILKIFQILNYDFDVIDAELCTKETLLGYDQVWMFSCDIMGRDVQEKLADFVTAGGNLVVYPTFPKYDLSMEKCSILKDVLGKLDEKVTVLDAPKVKVLENPDISVLNPVITYEKVKGASDVLKTDSGEVCGFIANVGKGKIMALGAIIPFGIEEHKKAFTDLIEKMSNVKKLTDRSKDRLILKQRSAKDGAFLFVGNYYNEVESDKIFYTHPVTGKKISMLLSGDALQVPGIYGFVSPISKKIVDGLKILHTTSDITGIDISKKEIKIRFIGNSILSGEMAFEKNTSFNVFLDNKKIDLKKSGEYFYVNYEHTGKEQEVRISR